MLDSRDRTAKLVNGALKTLVVGGAVGTIVIAPNALQLFESALKHLDKRERRQEQRRILRYMRQRALIDWQELPSGELSVTVTQKGRQRLEQVNFTELQIPQQKKWDKKWRLVMFDIPEAKRDSRSALSMKLKRMGFLQLQKSAWIHPYPCANEVELVKQVFGIPDSTLIFAEITNIDNEYKLIKHFETRN